MTDPVDTDALRKWASEEPSWDDIDRGWAGEALSAIGELADEVDRLRAELQEAERRFEHASAVANAEKARADALRDEQEGLVDQHALIKPREENRRLRAVIEDAPHDVDSCARCTYDGYDAGRPCTCWKADA